LTSECTADVQFGLIAPRLVKAQPSYASKIVFEVGEGTVLSNALASSRFAGLTWALEILYQEEISSAPSE
jgi:hypothetical protein